MYSITILPAVCHNSEIQSHTLREKVWYSESKHALVKPSDHDTECISCLILWSRMIQARGTLAGPSGFARLIKLNQNNVRVISLPDTHKCETNEINAFR